MADGQDPAVKPETEVDGYEPIASDDPTPTGDGLPDEGPPDAPSEGSGTEEGLDKSGTDHESEPVEGSDAENSSGDTASKKKAAEKAAMMERMRRRKAKHRAMTDPIRSMAEKILVTTVLLVFLLYAGYGWWTSHRLDSFRADVQAEVNRPDGIDKLRFIDDWRVQDIAPGTKRVSCADGKYVVFVWRLPDGKYMVDSVDR